MSTKNIIFSVAAFLLGLVAFLAMGWYEGLDLTQRNTENARHVFFSIAFAFISGYAGFVLSTFIDDGGVK